MGSGLAEKIMRKLSIHGIKTVAVIQPQHIIDDYFAEMAMEENHFINFVFSMLENKPKVGYYDLEFVQFF